MINSDIYALRLSKIGDALTILPVKEMGSQYALDFTSCPLPESVCKQKINEQFSSAYLAGGYDTKGISKERYIDMGIAHILRSPFFGDANKVLLEGDRVILVYKTNSIFTLEQLLKELHASEIRKAVSSGKPVDWDTVEEDHPGVFNKDDSAEDPMQGFSSDFEDMLYGNEERSRNEIFTAEPGIINKLQTSREGAKDSNLSPLDFFSTGSSVDASIKDENAAAEARFAMAEKKALDSFSDLFAEKPKPQEASAVMNVDSLVNKKGSGDYIEDVFIFNENLSQPAENNPNEASLDANGENFAALEGGESNPETDVYTKPFDFEGKDEAEVKDAPITAANGYEGSIEDRLINEDKILAPNVIIGTDAQPQETEQPNSGDGFNFWNESTAACDTNTSNPVIRPLGSTDSPEANLDHAPSFEFGPEEVGSGSSEHQDRGQLPDRSVLYSTPDDQPPSGQNSSPALFSESPPASPGLTEIPDFSFESSDEHAESTPIKNEKQEVGVGFNFDQEYSGPEMSAPKVDLEANGWVDNESFGGLNEPAPWESTLSAFGKKQERSESKGN